MGPTNSKSYETRLGTNSEECLVPNHQRCAAADSIRWATPTHRNEDDKAEGIRQITSKLSPSQRPGKPAIVGGLKTSRMDSKCAHADVLQAQLELDKHR